MSDWCSRDVYGDCVIDLRKSNIPSDIKDRVYTLVTHESLPYISGYKVFLRVPYDISIMKRLLTECGFVVHHATSTYILIHRNTGLPDYFTACNGASSIIMHNDQILVCQDRYHDMPFPGGGVNKGELPHTAAIRETKEEIGLDIEIDKPVACWIRPNFQYNLTDYHIIYKAHLIDNNTINIKEDNNEILKDSTKFITLDTFYNLDIKPFYKKIVKHALGNTEQDIYDQDHVVYFF